MIPGHPFGLMWDTLVSPAHIPCHPTSNGEGPVKKIFSHFHTFYETVYVYLGVCKVSLIKIRFFFEKMYIDLLRTICL